MLEIKNLTVRLMKNSYNIISDLNLVLNKEDKVAVIGEEGNGKSSLIKILCEKEEAKKYLEYSGEIFFKNEILAYLPQNIEQSIDLSSKQFIFGAKQYEEIDFGLYFKLLNELEIDEKLISEKIIFNNLSGGEKVKLFLLRELMKKPTLLVLNEPSNDLDIGAVLWLEKFIKSRRIPVMFVSHDEFLLKNCANRILLLENLWHRQKAKHTFMNMTYDEFVMWRENNFIRETKLAENQRAIFDDKINRYMRIYQNVNNALASSRDPAVSKNLKDKMHTVKSMGRRFEKEREKLPIKPDREDSIFIKFRDDIRIPHSKVVINFETETLCVGDRYLSKNIKLKVFGGEHLCIIGENGSGKTTLLREIIKFLKVNRISYSYMPQNYTDEMDYNMNVLDFLNCNISQEDVTKINTYMGSLNFSYDEMKSKLSDISQGQRAKIYILKLMLEGNGLIILDEPTRNLSPLSGPEFRNALKVFKGTIIAASHDRKFILELGETVYRLESEGLKKVYHEELVDEFCHGL